MAFAWWPITILRAVAVPGWEDKVSIPLTTDRVFPSGSQHQVIAPNRVLQLREDFVVLEKPFEGSCEVPFWRCIIATGASQPVPTMPDPRWSEAEFKAGLKIAQDDIRKATRVVVAGGGAVGIEIAGEIKAHYPEKQVTIVHKDIGLMSPTACAKPVDPTALAKEHGKIKSWSTPPTDIRLSKEMERICDKLGIEVILSDRVRIPSTESTSSTQAADTCDKCGETEKGSDAEGEVPAQEPPTWDGKWGLQDGLRRVSLESRRTLEADYVYPGCGMRPNSDIVGGADMGALDGALVAVDDYLKITSTTPSSIFSKGQYYAIGDVCNTPGFKIAHNAFSSAHRAAGNIINEIKGKSVVKYNPGSAQGIFRSETW
ncbi:hypothetical protein I316_04986 [Kwoniella heveanensis BCC8398]|uniref:FAD/NAD(P)-binding domain-containing protein n=1 Tax=Kwoniella heveanensis BCC8398 TaxID=1296120 RepID=A0A1B9GQV6_9TREE|nr:hypothetical protein I316_04986 [Kwoniella heveanensis BCC8398]